jgi:hypothetical protein
MTILTALILFSIIVFLIGVAFGFVLRSICREREE